MAGSVIAKHLCALRHYVFRQGLLYLKPNLRISCRCAKTQIAKPKLILGAIDSGQLFQRFPHENIEWEVYLARQRSLLRLVQAGI